jgi:hypothetical protein
MSTGEARKQQVSPLRFAPVEMATWRQTLSHSRLEPVALRVGLAISSQLRNPIRTQGRCEHNRTKYQCESDDAPQESLLWKGTCLLVESVDERAENRVLRIDAVLDVSLRN